MNIKDIIAREILDSRGNPTVEVKMILANGLTEIASVPSGASTGMKEALELRDNDNRYNGKGVLKAVANINNIIRPALIGKKIDQLSIDKELLRLDGTENKSKLGANAILAVSVVTLKCIAKLNNKELYELVSSGKVGMPIPMVNIINGGVHSSNDLDIQEFMIVPVIQGEKERIRAASEVFHSLGKILKDYKLSTAVGDEGGYAPDIRSTRKALDLIMEAIKKAGYVPGKDIFIALDVAASELCDNDIYNIDGMTLTPNELIKYYLSLIKEYPIISIEDPFEENDLESLSVLTKLVGQKVMIVGDDYFCSNEKYLEMGIKNEAGNAILLKPNQIGTVTEFIKTIVKAKKSGYSTIMSHRSGETNDIYIADFAVGFNTNFIKTGSLSRGERICKYNRLMEIEDKLNN